MSKMLGLRIMNYSTNYYKCKLRYFRSAYTFNTQDDGAAMFFVIVKMVQLDTRAGFSDIKSKLENMKMYYFEHEIPNFNLQVAEWTNKISISGGKYSEIVR